MVVCLKQVADLHMSQLMPLPLTVSCFSKIQIGFIFLVPAYTGSPGKRSVKWVCVCLCMYCLLFAFLIGTFRYNWFIFAHKLTFGLILLFLSVVIVVFL